MTRFILTLSLLFALGFGPWAAPTMAIGPTAPSWKPRETVASAMTNHNSMRGADRSLAYDHHGNPGIAFYDAVNGDLRYAQRLPGAVWSHAAVDTGGVVGTFPSLAFDRYERPAISYWDDTNDDLEYAHFRGGAWQIESVDTPTNTGAYSSLAFDNLGRPAIAYYDLTASSLRFVLDVDGDFSLLDETPVTVVNDFDEGLFASLVFDQQNRPMIAHQNVTNADLRFSVAEPGIGWVTTTVESAGSTGFDPSIAINPGTGFPAIAYFEGGPDNLRYAAWDGSAWNKITVESTGSSGWFPSLAFDPADGNPAIAYYDFTNGAVKLAWHDGTAWQTQTVDTAGDVGRAPSLAFNDYGTGFPSIAYTDSSVPSTLLFIEDPPAVPEPASVMLLAIGLALGTGWRKRRRIVA